MSMPSHCRESSESIESPFSSCAEERDKVAVGEKDGGQSVRWETSLRDEL